MSTYIITITDKPDRRLTADRYDASDERWVVFYADGQEVARYDQHILGGIHAEVELPAGGYGDPR